MFAPAVPSTACDCGFKPEVQRRYLARRAVIWHLQRIIPARSSGNIFLRLTSSKLSVMLSCWDVGLLGSLSQFRHVTLPPSHQSNAPPPLNRGFVLHVMPDPAFPISLARSLLTCTPYANRNQSPQSPEAMRHESGCCLRSGSALAQASIGCLKPVDADLGESDDEESGSRMQAAPLGDTLGG
jgi:hypothetical protein